MKSICAECICVTCDDDGESCLAAHCAACIHGCPLPAETPCPEECQARWGDLVAIARHTVIEDNDGAPLPENLQPRWMIDEIERMRRWKAEATELLDQVYAISDTIPNQPLGSSRITNIGLELDRMRAELERTRQAWIVVRQRVPGRMQGPPRGVTTDTEEPTV